MKFAMAFASDGEALARTLNELPLRVQKGILLEALTVGAEPIRAAGERFAPRSEDPPHVGEHIVIGNAREKGVGASIAVGPSRDFEARAVIYPFAQEFGTTRHGAQPFMRPAFDLAARHALAPIAATIWRGLVARGFGSARASGAGGGLL